VLKATNTPLLALPATIGGCVSLEVLRVDGTKLSELPPNVTECRNLLVRVFTIVAGAGGAASKRGSHFPP
jgi:hypothetical protein